MSEIIEMTADIVSAYLQHNHVSAAEVPSLIRSVHGALSGTATAPQPEPAELVPAVSIKKSLQPDYLICLEDGRKFKSLKRHLRSKYGLSPEEYRAKWGLPDSYPMVCSSYSASRSALAVSMGLGVGGRKAAKPAVKAKAPRKAKVVEAEA